ncbi:MAG: molybdopterin-guanine dinucleotide biosynthesis protein B [Chloroflexi bacterium]|nr:molybdopterin-guanine dinucleotide biosynthesis protein B [Chloroflexota bacterium]
MVPAICFTGKSGSGKTTLIVRVVEELKRRRFRVAVIKHAPHGFELDKPGKDSWRFSSAGSDTVALVSPGGIAVMARLDGDRYLQTVICQMSLSNDIVLIEGCKGFHLPKVLVSCGEEGSPLSNPGDNLIAIVSDRVYDYPVPRFSPAEAGRLVELLESLIHASKDQGNGGAPHPMAQLRETTGQPEELAPF